MKNKWIQKFFSCFSIFVFVFAMVAPISNIYAEYNRGISKKEYSEHLATYQENLDEFKKNIDSINDVIIEKRIGYINKK